MTWQQKLAETAGEMEKAIRDITDEMYAKHPHRSPYTLLDTLGRSVLLDALTELVRAQTALAQIETINEHSH